jgi:hypothetical protein
VVIGIGGGVEVPVDPSLWVVGVAVDGAVDAVVVVLSFAEVGVLLPPTVGVTMGEVGLGVFPPPLPPVTLFEGVGSGAFVVVPMPVLVGEVGPGIFPPPLPPVALFEGVESGAFVVVPMPVLVGEVGGDEVDGEGFSGLEVGVSVGPLSLVDGPSDPELKCTYT